MNYRFVCGRRVERSSQCFLVSCLFKPGSCCIRWFMRVFLLGSWRLLSGPNGGGTVSNMPDKKLMYESSIIDYKSDTSGRPVEVTLVEVWGKGSRRRARWRVLEKSEREYVSGGGYVSSVHGSVVYDGQVYEVEEVSGERWWVRPIEWGDRNG